MQNEFESQLNWGIMIDQLDFRIVRSGTPDEDAAFSIQEQHRKFFFVPESVFRKAVEKGLVLGAFQNDEVVAYVWAKRKDGVISVRYLCVHRDNARMGIGRSLVEELKQRNGDAFRIRLSCRTDYPGWKFWKGIGFHVLRNRPGKAKAGSEVTDFVCDLSPLPLFAEFADKCERPRVAIDANVYFDLCDPNRRHHLESTGLLADWVDSEFDLCVTDALKEDIARGTSASSEYQWPIVRASAEAFECIHQQVISLLGPGSNEQDKSDRNHLSHAIAENVATFVTRDGYLLENADKIYNQFGIAVLRPVEFVVNVDSDSNQHRFDRKDLESVRMSIVRTGHDEDSSDDLANLIRQNEKLAKLKAQLRGWLANPDRFEVLSILDAEGTTQATCVIETSARKVSVHLLRASVRLKGKRKGRTILRCLIAQLRSRLSHSALVEITDEVGVAEAMEALREFGFTLHNGKAFKVCLCGVWELKDAFDAVEDLASESDGGVEVLGGKVSSAFNAEPLAYLELEHRLWPAKIRSGGRVPCIAIPIRPTWARALFDPNLGQVEFWDEDANLLLNPTNAYYTGARPDIDQGRVIWYVSWDDNYPGSKQIRAVSQMTRRVIAPPLQCYREFRHFGVYRLTDIEGLANPKRPDVMAVEFRDTELMTNPISLSATREILKAPKEAFQWPTKIAEPEFLEIYQLGTG